MNPRTITTVHLLQQWQPPGSVSLSGRAARARGGGRALCGRRHRAGPPAVCPEQAPTRRPGEDDHMLSEGGRAGMRHVPGSSLPAGRRGTPLRRVR
jgi:hypothetical protein